MSVLHSFLLLNNIPLCGHTILFILSSIAGHWGCFLFFSFLAIMNDIALNMCVQGFVWLFFIPLSTYLGGTVPLFGYRLLILVGIWFACCSLRWLLFYWLKESKDLFISFYVERERRRER